MVDVKHTDDGLKLSPDELARVRAHFEKMLGDRACHICGAREWNTLPSMYTPIVFDRVNNFHRNDRLLPQVGVICLNCSTTTMFAAVNLEIPQLSTKAYKDGGSDD